MQAASFSEQRWIKPVSGPLYLPQRERYATTMHTRNTITTSPNSSLTSLNNARHADIYETEH